MTAATFRAQKAVLDMETAIRGFLLTRDERALHPFDAGRRAAPAAVVAMHHAERDEPVDLAAIAAIEQEIDAYIGEYALPVIRRVRAGRLTRPELRRTAAEGKGRVDGLRAAFTDVFVRESGEASSHLATMDRATTAARNWSLLGVLASVVMIACGGVAARRWIVVPLIRIGEGAERVAAGDLGFRVAGSALPELSRLGRAFNRMSDGLEEGRRALVRHADELEAAVKDRTADLEASRLETLGRLARAAEFRDDDTREHTERVARTAALLARRLGWTDAQVAQLELAAPLHDIGKIAIPDAILLKPGGLTEEEFEHMRSHAATGAEMLAGSTSPVLQMAERIALAHHERWDGSGYPHGIAGQDIDIAARIVAVADVFDALTHERPYKRAWPAAEARDEILAQAGSQFDPDVVQAFAALPVAELRAEATRAAGPTGPAVAEEVPAVEHAAGSSLQRRQPPIRTISPARGEPPLLAT
jgi:putative nucleotidyltransferase with HDIG domain